MGNQTPEPCYLCGRPTTERYCPDSWRKTIPLCRRWWCRLRIHWVAVYWPWDPWGELGELMDPHTPPHDS